MPQNTIRNNGVSEDIRQMKLRARVETDAELAAILGKHRSVIAQWRSRGAIPDNALLRFENRLAGTKGE